jgi:CheY-like chemotaxis protein
MEIEALKLNNNNNKIHLAADMVVGAEVQRYTAYAREKNQMLDIKLQKLAFYGLPGVLDLITANLLSNAIKYTPAGGTVSIELIQETAQLCLIVKDSGQGIPLDEHEKIFLRHYRRSGQENIAGTGEGLFLVKTCVECAGGSIELVSKPNAGSCFTIRLPLGDLRQISTPEYKPSQLMLLPPHSSARISTPEPCLTPTLSATILLVEDNDDLRNDISGLLQSNYHCVTASDGKMGVELATKLLPDLIISDVMMEQHDSGLRMLTQLKSQLQTSHIPVILLTALSNETAQADGYQAAACLYLNKPVSSQLLLNAVASVLEQYRSMTKGVRAALQPVNSADDSPTELFRLKLNAVFASVYTDTSVNVETLAGYFHKSASQLNRICKSELGVTLIDGLNAYRVTQACQLMLTESQYSIETISEKCGFGCVKTMQRQFVKQVKMTPAEYRQMQHSPK